MVFCTWLLWKHCYHGNKGLFNYSTIGSIASLYLMHMFLGTNVSLAYNVAMETLFLICFKDNTYFNSTFLILKHSHTSKSMLTSGGTSLVRTISSSRISCHRPFFQINTTTNNPLCNFGYLVLHTFHQTAHILYGV